MCLPYPRSDVALAVARRSAAALAAMLCLLMGASGVHADDRLKVAVAGVRGVGENFTVDIGLAQGIFKKHGLDVEVLTTDSTGDTQQVVISNSANVGTGVGILGALSAFSKGAPVRILGANFTGGSQNYWYVPSNSWIKSVQDAGGKTVAYSSFGSSTHAAVLALQKYSGINFKPTATGATPATLVAVMSGQIDVGWAGAPFGMQDLASGKIRLVWKASAVPSLDRQTIRVMIANANDLRARPDVYVRFLRAFRETLDWIYSTPEGAKAYAEWASLPEALAQHAIEQFLPKEALNPDRISGLDDAMADAISYKYISAPLTNEQLNELIRISERRQQ
jgi:NitT/TauT family transport system substrate-binding protein